MGSRWNISVVATACTATLRQQNYRLRQKRMFLHILLPLQFRHQINHFFEDLLRLLLVNLGRDNAHVFYVSVVADVAELGGCTVIVVGRVGGQQHRHLLHLGGFVNAAHALDGCLTLDAEREVVNGCHQRRRGA